MLKPIETLLGKVRLRVLLALFVTTGLLSTVLLFVDAEWSATAQTLSFVVFALGATGIVFSALDGEQRMRWLALLAPAIGLVIIGALFFPQYMAFVIGGAVGWILAGALIFGKSKAPIEYRTAVKALRRGDYDAAIKTMDGLIKIEPHEANHYRFRAELLRLAGRLPRARQDYDKMIKVAKDDTTRAVGYNGLSEVDLQARVYTNALENAQKAYALSANWVTAYNMGMIQDRLGDSEEVIKSLQQALADHVPDARHRLMIQLYLVRAFCRLGRMDDAQKALKTLKAHKNSLKDWEKVLSDDKATVLRDVLSEDVTLLKQLISGERTLEQLT